MTKGKKAVVIIICILFALTLLIYFAGVWFFGSHFLPGSRVSGLDCSFKTEQQVQEAIASRISTYQLELVELNESTEIISAEDIGLAYVEDDSVQQLLAAQDRWKWFLSAGGTKKYSMSAATTYNADQLEQVVASLKCMQDAVEPEDAHIDYQEGEYIIIPEVVGTAPNQEKLLSLVTAAVEGGQDQVNLVEEACYLKPAVYQDDEALIQETQELNQYVKVTIYYDFGDREEVVDGDLIRQWLVKGDDGSYSLDEEAMKEYVYQLAYKYDTFGGTRSFVTATGETIEIKGGDYGYVIKQQDTMEELKAAIMTGESKTMEPVYLYKGVCRDTNDIGTTYVEINLTTQMMYFYKDGKLLVETPVVTGNPAKGNATPTGVYALDTKKSPAVLKGEDYASDVTYWMPFNKNVGIHDCGTWRTEFGGNIYLTNGSHGCVNTPYEAAETIYNNIEIGMPIIVY